MISGYGRLLAIPGVPRLTVSIALTRVPNGVLALASLLLLRDQTHSFAIAGLGVGAFSLANAATSPVQGALVDRLGQPSVLGVCAVGQSAMLIGVVAAAYAHLPAALVVLLLTAAGALAPPTMACARALWPTVSTDAATRDVAYALDAIATEVAWILGPLLVAVVVAVASPSVAVLLCALIIVGGTALFATSPICRRWRGNSDRRGPRSGALSTPRLRSHFIAAALLGFWWGAIQVGLPALAIHLRSPGSAGVLLALISVGGVVGGFLYGSRKWTASLAARYCTLLLALAFALSPLVVARSLTVAMPLCVGAGLAFTPALSCQSRLIGATAPADVMTEAFTWSAAAGIAGTSAGLTAAGPLESSSVGLSGPFAIACAAAVLAAAIIALSTK